MLLPFGSTRAQQYAPASPIAPSSLPATGAAVLPRFAAQNRGNAAPRPAQPDPALLAPNDADAIQTAPFKIQLEVPSIERVTQSVESDAQFRERLRQDGRARKIPEGIEFPNDPVISTQMYRERNWNPMKLEVAPYYVCHGRLYFQQINAERYGWDLGVFAPLVSGTKFLYDFVTWPYHLAVEPCRRFDYNTGMCLPGDPVPLLLYPLHPSATGFVAEVGTVLTLVAVFP